jgi:UDP-N-acetylglucosamine 2-epimerase (non-hydrolysing)
LTEPLGYLEFLCLMAGARFVLTDSGGIQEETTYLGIPCLTLRHNTERPVTISLGTNQLVGTDPETIITTVKRVMSDRIISHQIPPFWDGRASERIVKDLADNLLRS